jgi:transcriptional regulator with XRE-family HTH domain
MGIIRIMSRELSLSDEIRQAVDASGLSRYRIAKELGISESTMSRFMNRKGGLTLKLLDRLADLLGLHITVERKAGG